MSLASAASHPGIQPRDTPPPEAAAAMSGYEVSTASSGSHPANLARRMKAIGDHVLVRARPQDLPDRPPIGRNIPPVAAPAPRHPGEAPAAPAARLSADRSLAN